MPSHPLLAKINYVAEVSRVLQTSRPSLPPTEEEKRRLQADLKVLPVATRFSEDNRRCLRLSDILEQLHTYRLSDIPLESIRFYVNIIMDKCTAAFNGTCGQLLPQPYKAVLREDLDSTSCRFPCNRKSHSLAEHLLQGYDAQLRYPYAPLLNFSYEGHMKLIISLEQTWVEIPKIPVHCRGLNWRELEDYYRSEANFQERPPRL